MMRVVWWDTEAAEKRECYYDIVTVSGNEVRGLAAWPKAPRGGSGRPRICSLAELLYITDDAEEVKL